MASNNKYDKLAGKNVLVIGGSAGIGLGVAEAALAAGANVTISSSSQARLDAAVAGLQAGLPPQEYPEQRVRAVQADLSDAGALPAVLEALFAAAAPTNHVVLTAADGLALSSLGAMTPAVAQAATHMRFVVPLMVAQAAARWLPRTRQASLTLTTGAAAERPGKGWAIVTYLAGGIQALARALAVEMAPIRINAVRPGVVDTGLWAPDERAALMTQMENSMLTGSPGRVEDVAEAYLWLMKDGNVTGTVAGTDSGCLLV